MFGYFESFYLIFNFSYKSPKTPSGKNDSTLG